MFLDDIPIQLSDELNASNNTSQLVSITEESEAISGGSNTEPQLGMRNNLVRSSKEILKTHKVPFPGFKKLKDKEKDKDKDTSGNSASTTSILSATGSTIIAGAKLQSNKNGNIFTDGVKESVIIAATKQLTKKDKRASSATLQTASIDVGDSTYLDKGASPSMQIKRKSNSIDVTSNGPMVQMQTFSNGNSIITEEKLITPTITTSIITSSKPITTITSGNGNSGGNLDFSTNNDGNNLIDSNTDASATRLVTENSF